MGDDDAGSGDDESAVHSTRTAGQLPHRLGVAGSTTDVMRTADDPDQRRSIGVVRRTGWLLLGLACVAIGGIGVVVPGLPTTIFFIVAAGAFAKSSPRLEAWVLGLPTIGPLVRDHRDGLGMPKRAKYAAVATIGVAVGISAWLIDGWLLPLIVVALGAIGVTVVLRQPTKPT